MERVNCVVLEDNILEFLDEIQTQMEKGIICCKCKQPCDSDNMSKCKMAMKNLLTDINIFKKAYSEVNIEESVETPPEKQQIND